MHAKCDECREYSQRKEKVKEEEEREKRKERKRRIKKDLVGGRTSKDRGTESGPENWLGEPESDGKRAIETQGESMFELSV